MLGGRILGEGVDGCIMENPGWPCIAGSKGVPEPTDTRYVSKIVPINDAESLNLKLANKILGSELASKYLAGLRGECRPADAYHPPNSKNTESYISAKRNVNSWKKTGQSCEKLKDTMTMGKDITQDNKIMYLTKYNKTISDWIDEIQRRSVPYEKVMHDIELAVPNFLMILQKFYQGETQLIHLDLHTGNIFIKENPFELGMADFGHCVFRHESKDPAITFYGEFLVNNVAKFTFYDGHFPQLPFECCLLNYCFRKNMESVDTYTFIKSWYLDSDVRQFSASSSDSIFANKKILVTELLKKPLFISMLEVLQSITRKLRRNVNSMVPLVQSLSTTEKDTIEFILTRYHAISPFNTISEDIMNVYQKREMTHLTKYILKSIQAPYESRWSSLSSAFKAIQGADLTILWSDIVSGKTS